MTFKNLSPVGKYLHRVKQYIVLRSTGNVPRIGARVYSKDGKRLGVVTDVFGPVSNPYILVKGERADVYYARGSDLLNK